MMNNVRAQATKKNFLVSKTRVNVIRPTNIGLHLIKDLTMTIPRIQWGKPQL
jgi:hypothetical protein